MTEDNERKAAERAWAEEDEAVRPRKASFIAGWLARARLAPKGEAVAKPTHWYIESSEGLRLAPGMDENRERDVCAALNIQAARNGIAVTYRVVPLYAAPVPCAQSNENRNSAPPAPASGERCPTCEGYRDNPDVTDDGRVCPNATFHHTPPRDGGKEE